MTPIMIFSVGYDDLGRRVAALEENPGGTFTLQVFKHSGRPELFGMPNLSEALRVMKRNGATLIIASPAESAVVFTEKFSEALQR